jgi:tetratricopeptide (TPR) repeat protein
MKKLLLAMLLVICTGTALWGEINENLDEGLKLAREGKYKEAMITWKKGVEEGNGDSAALIGYLYQSGVSKEIPKNPEKALEWYNKAMDMGSPRARVYMARVYVEGYGGIEKDLTKAYELIKGLEDSDSNFALDSLSRFYANGYGTSVDFVKAREIANKISDPKVKQDALAGIDAIELSSKVIAAQELITEIQQNQMRFDKNYKGKTITVSGYVGKIEEKGEGYALQLFGEKEGLVNPFSHVECRFRKSQEDALLELNKDDAVKIKGIYNGKEQFQIGAFVLLNCEVVK